MALTGGVAQGFARWPRRWRAHRLPFAHQNQGVNRRRNSSCTRQIKRADQMQRSLASCQRLGYIAGCRAISSVGRASRLHRECRRFEPVIAHHWLVDQWVADRLVQVRPKGAGVCPDAQSASFAGLLRESAPPCWRLAGFWSCSPGVSVCSRNPVIKPKSQGDLPKAGSLNLTPAVRRPASGASGQFNAAFSSPSRVTVM